MSTSVDSRIVEMRFDNADFEKKIQSTLSSLDKMNKALTDNLVQNGAESFKGITDAANNFNLDGVNSAVDNAGKSFSALEVIGITALANITNAAVNYGRNMFSNLINGGKQRALNITQATFMFEGLKYAEEEIGSVGKSGTIMDNIYQSVKGTFYSLDKAALVASQFLAAGIKKEDLTGYLKGVAGVASMFNMDYQRVGEIFSKVRTQGKLMGQDLQSLNVNGVPTIATITDYLNEMGKTSKYTQEQVSEMVSKGKIDFDTFAGAMNWAFGKQAAKSKQLFTGAVEDVIAALARVGEKAWTPLLLVERDVLNALVPLIDSISGRLTPAFEKWASLCERLGRGLTRVIDFISAIVDYKETITQLSELTDKDLMFNGKYLVDPKRVEFLKKYKDTIDDIRDTMIRIATPVKQIGSSTFKILKSIGKVMWEVVKGTTPLISSIAKGIAALADGITAFNNYISKLDIIGNITRIVTKGVDGLSKAFKKLSESIGKGLSNFFDGFSMSASKLSSVLSGAGLTFIITRLVAALNYLKNPYNWITKAGGELKGMMQTFKQVGASLFELEKVLSAYQTNIKANYLQKLAIGLLAIAGSCYILSKIDSNSLIESSSAMLIFMGAMTKMAGALAAIGTKNAFGLYPIGGILLSIGLSLVLIAAAMKIMSTLNFGQICQGLFAIGSVMEGMYLFASKLEVMDPKGLKKAATSMILLAGGLVLISIPIQKLGSMDLTELAKGLGSVASLMAGLFFFASKLTTSVNLLEVGVGLLLVAGSIALISVAIQRLGSMSLDQLVQSLLAIGIAIGELVIIMNAAAFGLAGAAAIFVISGALILLSLALAAIGSMDFNVLAQGILGIGVALLTLGLCATVLAPLVVPMLALAGVLTLIGIAALSFGAGMILIGTGIGIIASTAGMLGGFVAVMSVLALTLLVLAAEAVVVTLPLIALGAALVVLGAGAILSGVGMSLLATAFVTLSTMADKLPEIADNMIKMVPAMIALGFAGPGLLVVGAGLIAIGLGLTTISIGAATSALTLPKVTTQIKEFSSVTKSSSSGIHSGFNTIINSLKAFEIKMKETFVSCKNLGTALKDMASSIKRYKGSFEKAGEYLIEGLINGIKNKMPSLRSAATNAGKEALASAKRALREKSPSKATTEMGENFDQGLINGINNLSGKVSKSAYTMGEDSLSALAEAIGGASELIDQDINPTITPVVDLSNVNAAARSINASLSTKQAMGISANMVTQQNRLDVATNQILAGMKDAVVNASAIQNEGEMQSVTIEVPLNINGREFARATVSDIQTQLNVNQARSDRLVGAQ